MFHTAFIIILIIVYFDWLWTKKCENFCEQNGMDILYPIHNKYLYPTIILNANKWY